VTRAFLDGPLPPNQTRAPSEVEETLYRHPAVLEAGVTGAPESTYGEVVVAFVVRREGQMVDEGELRAFCGQRLADYKLPERIVFLDALPKGLTGKVGHQNATLPGGTATTSKERLFLRGRLEFSGVARSLFPDFDACLTPVSKLAVFFNSRMSFFVPPSSFAMSSQPKPIPSTSHSRPR
jgi:hypothetical protein